METLISSCLLFNTVRFLTFKTTCILSQSNVFFFSTPTGKDGRDGVNGDVVNFFYSQKYFM